MTDKMYFDFIRNAIATEGTKVADTANKIALEQGKITQEQYSKAAWMIVEAVLGD